MNQPRPLSAESSSVDRPNSDWLGSLQLVFAHQRGTTQLIHNTGQAPLKVQRPFYPEGNEICHSVIMHTAGGLVGGDRLTYDIHLEPDSNALITTPAAGKIYRSTGKEAQQIIHLTVSEGACLEWLPQETIVFNQALYHQQLRVNLAPNAHWLGWEMTRFGRSARGEKFIQGNWRSHTEVWQHDRPIWIDRQWFPGSAELFESPHGLAGCPIVGSFAWIGQPVESDLIEKIRSFWTGQSGEIGVTRLSSGLLCRYRGHSTTEARQWFIQTWQWIRSTYFHRSRCLPRVWQL